MDDAIKIFEGSKHYANLLDSFTCEDKLNVDLDGTAISEAMFFHICKMKYAGWRHRINFKRYRKHTISDFFQDIIAFYLKVALPKDYSVELEDKIGKTQPDIAIKLDNKYIFLIEVKTNIGWDRPDKKLEDPYAKIKVRVDELSTNFAVPNENIIYIFEEHGNVSREFSENYWDKDRQKARKERPMVFPFSIIYPLFNATDPYYWKFEKGFDKTKGYKEIPDEEIRKQAKLNIVTPIEEIFRLILRENA